MLTFFVGFRDSAESTRRRPSGSEQQLQSIGHVEQTFKQFSIGQRVRGECDHA